MKTLITLIIVSLFLIPMTMAAEYTAITKDNTVEDRNTVHVMIAVQVEETRIVSLQSLLNELEAQRAIRDAAIVKIREIGDLINLVEPVVDTVKLGILKPEPLPDEE